MTDCLEFRLLGPMEVLADGRPVIVEAPRPRIVLAMLLLERGRLLSAERLIEAVWGEAPPATARSQVQYCVAALRRRFVELGSPDLITTRPSGYVLHAADANIDVNEFERLVSKGRAAAQQRDPALAVDDLRAALSLWRGQALTDVNSGLVHTFATQLNEERFAVQEECIGLELALGRHGAVIGELSRLVETFPLREKLWASLMLALYRAGRQGEALATYRRAQQVFAEELGLDPAEELRVLERGILQGEPSLELPTDAADTAAAIASRPAVPRQLPSAIPDFVGRSETARQIRGHLTPGGCGGSHAPRHVEVVVVGGRSGVGKSALALHVAHGVREHYPDGQLFAHLRGDEPRPAPPEQVLERFLRALGVAPGLLPDQLEDLEALYRSKLADRRILVVLDDAVTEEQVLPFVPGEPGCALLVTSRRQLLGLHGAHRVDLDVFSPLTSVALLAEVMGKDRVRAEAGAAAALAEACGHLPLALRVAGARLSARRHWSVALMVDRLTDEGRRLDELTLGDVGVRASIALSYQALGDRARRLLLLLATLGQTDFAHWVAGPLLDVDLASADEILDELVQARLVEVQVGVDRGVRFHLHDLVRIFAVECLASGIMEGERRQAHHRLLRCWLFLADEAHRRERSDCAVLHSDTARWELPAHVVDSLVADPLVWFQSEQANLVAAIRSAADNDHDDLCWDLCLTAADFFESLDYTDAWKQTHDIALQAVRRAHNQRGEAAMLLSSAGLPEDRLSDIQEDLQRALTWFNAAGDVHGRGLVLRELGVLDRLCGRQDLALTRLEQALVDLRAVRDRSGEAHALNTMAKVWLERGLCDEAETLLRQALTVCPARARRVKVQLAYWVGETHRARGELVEAESAFRRVLRVVAELNDPVGRLYALLGLGRVRAARKEFESAEESLQLALELSDQTGERTGKCLVLLTLAELALGIEDVDAASARLEEFNAISASIGEAAAPLRTADVRERLRRVARSLERPGAPTTR